MKQDNNKKLEIYKENQRKIKQMGIIVSRLTLAGAIAIALMVGFIVGVVI